MFLLAQQIIFTSLYAMYNKFSWNCFLTILDAPWTFVWSNIGTLDKPDLAKLQLADWLFNKSFKIES